MIISVIFLAPTLTQKQEITYSAAGPLQKIINSVQKRWQQDKDMLRKILEIKLAILKSPARLRLLSVAHTYFFFLVSFFHTWRLE